MSYSRYATNILIIGDVMLDRYLYGTVAGHSPEFPEAPVFAVEHESFAPGGAANVAMNVRALMGSQGTVRLIGTIGEDVYGLRLRRLLREAGIETVGLIVDPSRPTTTKTRVVNGSRHEMRIDHEAAIPLSLEIEEQAVSLSWEALDKAECVILSDYANGMLSGELAQDAINMAGQKVPVIVDPKGSHYERYQGGTMITPNLAEAEQCLGRTIDPECLDALAAAASDIASISATRWVLLKRAHRGMTLFFADKTQSRHYPAVANNVVDVCGAGDTVVAALAVHFKEGVASAVEIASRAAAIAVGKPGTAAVTREELEGCLAVECQP